MAHTKKSPSPYRLIRMWSTVNDCLTLSRDSRSHFPVRHLESHLWALRGFVGILQTPAALHECLCCLHATVKDYRWEVGSHSECCATLFTILSTTLKVVRNQTKHQHVINTCLAVIGRLALLIAMSQNALHCYCVVTITIVVLFCKQRGEGYPVWVFFFYYAVNRCSFVNSTSWMET